MDKNESKYFNTAKKMDDALISLLGEKDFEYITVKDVCAKAKVNRSTFYLHYSNTRDLLEETISSVSASFASHFDGEETFATIVAKKDLSALFLIKDEYLLPYLEFVKENKKVYKAVIDHPELFNAGSSYSRLFQMLFAPIMSRFGLEKKWHEYLMDFYINGIASLILRWVAEDCQIPVEEMSAFIQGLVKKHNESQTDRNQE